MTKSSVNFKAVKSASHAVSHASRSVEPTYLLPKGKSLGTICLLDDRGNVASVIEAKMALASRQALRQGDYSPVWEGVINLQRPGVGCDVSQYKKDCKSIISEWCQSYQKMTGHTVLRADIHLDEGHVVDGETLLNAHAHVICDKTNEKGRVIKINAPELRKIQDMTAKVTGLDRGESSLKTGRKHIDHQAYKYLAERGRLETQQQVFDLKVIHEKELNKPKADLIRLQKLSTEWSNAGLAKVKDLEAKLDGEPARLAAAMKVQEDQLKEGYRLDRERMKEENAEALAAGLAKMHSQKDYQDLKTKHAEALADLKTKLAEALTQAAKVPSLEAQITLLTPEAGKVEGLKTKLAEALTQAAKVPDLVAEAVRAKNDEWVERAKVFTKSAQEQLDAVVNERNETVEELVTKLVIAQRPAPVVDTRTAREHARDAAKQQGEATTPVTQRERSTTPAQIPHEATKRAQEAPEQPEVPIPSPAPTKSLVELLAASMRAMLDWIKGVGGKVVEIDKQFSSFNGPVKLVGEFHCVQSKGRGEYVVHALADLDKLPQLDDPRMYIRYKDGVGHVEGKTGPGVQR